MVGLLTPFVLTLIRSFVDISSSLVKKRVATSSRSIVEEGPESICHLLRVPRGRRQVIVSILSATDLHGAILGFDRGESLGKMGSDEVP